MAVRKAGLGRGLESLIPPNPDDIAVGEFRQVAIDQISGQPRPAEKSFRR